MQCNILRWTHRAVAVSSAGNWFLVVGPLPMCTVSTCSPSCLHTTRYTCWKGPTIGEKQQLVSSQKTYTNVRKLQISMQTLVC